MERPLHHASSPTSLAGGRPSRAIWPRPSSPSRLLEGTNNQVKARYRRIGVAAILGNQKTMETLETYSSVLAVLSAGLLLVIAGLAKKRLVWKARRVRTPRRRNR